MVLEAARRLAVFPTQRGPAAGGGDGLGALGVGEGAAAVLKSRTLASPRTGMNFRAAVGKAQQREAQTSRQMGGLRAGFRANHIELALAAARSARPGPLKGECSELEGARDGWPRRSPCRSAARAGASPAAVTFFVAQRPSLR